METATVPFNVDRQTVKPVAEHLKAMEGQQSVKILAVGRPHGQIPGHHVDAVPVPMEKEVGQHPRIGGGQPGPIVSPGRLQEQRVHPVGSHLDHIGRPHRRDPAGVGRVGVKGVNPGPEARVRLDRAVDRWVNHQLGRHSRQRPGRDARDQQSRAGCSGHCGHRGD